MRTKQLDALVVGAGFSGLYALHRLRELGLSVRLVERGGGVGGTWYWNRYPGARCDIESVDYQFSFSEALLDEWEWTERYAAQPEILRYLDVVADRLDLRRDIELDTPVTAARYDEERDRWQVTTDRGVDYEAGFLILAVGNLSSPKHPDFPGLDSFEGEWYMTARWPQEPVVLDGKRVGVVGTGSTGIQVVIEGARSARDLWVFQRTPNYSMPAHNGPLDPAFRREVTRAFAERRRMCELSEAGVPFPAPEHRACEVSDAERRRMYEAGWARGGINSLSYAFSDFHSDEAANTTGAEFTRERIREIVRDPSVAALLSPSHHIGTRRTCVDTGYYEVFNQENVHLVDVRCSPIETITTHGIRTAGAEYELDVIAFALGFDAMTGGFLDIDIRGRGGLELRQKWAAGPRTYLGLTVAGFPNMFLVTGPGSPGVLSNMVVSIEQHVEWLADCIGHLRAEGLDVVEATPDAEDAWVAHVNEIAAATLYPQATSWYVGANVPGKPRVFMPYVGGCGRYRAECDQIARDGYQGFRLSRAPHATTTAQTGGGSCR
ncbi:MAG: flavin-containing monooxygenase [Gaiellales bacterium]